MFLIFRLRQSITGRQEAYILESRKWRFEPWRCTEESGTDELRRRLCLPQTPDRQCWCSCYRSGTRVRVRNVYRTVHSCIIPNSSKEETPQLSINGWVGKWKVTQLSFTCNVQSGPICRDRKQPRSLGWNGHECYGYGAQGLFLGNEMWWWLSNSLNTENHGFAHLKWANRMICELYLIDTVTPTIMSVSL